MRVEQGEEEGNGSQADRAGSIKMAWMLSVSLSIQKSSLSLGALFFCLFKQSFSLHRARQPLFEFRGHQRQKDAAEWRGSRINISFYVV